MLTWPPPYSPAAMLPSNDAYSSGWSSVGTASRFTPGSSGGAFGTAQLFRTPSRSRRRSQCTRSPRPRGVWCSWTTKVSSSPTGSDCRSAGTGSAVRAGSRLRRYSASGSGPDGSGPDGSGPDRRAGTSGAAAGGLARRLGGSGLLRRRRLLGGRRLLRRSCLLGGGGLLGRHLRRRRALLRRRRFRVAAAGTLDRGPQRAHQVDHGRTGVGHLGHGLHVAAGGLRLDQRLHRGAVVVAELGGVEVAGHRGDQRLGHLQLLRPYRDVLVEEAEVRRPDLVGPAHGVQDQHAVTHPQRGQRLPLPDGDLGDGDLPGVLQGV